MSAALVIAAKDLRQKLRDRSVLLMAVLAPLGLAFLFSTMLPNQETFHTTYAVVDLDGGEIAQGLVDGPLAGLATAGVADLVTLTTEADARAAVDAGDVAAAIVIPAGFTEAVQAGAPAQLLVIGGPSSLSAEIARSVLAGVRQPGHGRPGRGGHGAGGGRRGTRPGASPASSRRRPSRHRPRSS